MTLIRHFSNNHRRSSAALWGCGLVATGFLAVVFCATVTGDERVPPNGQAPAEESKEGDKIATQKKTHPANRLSRETSPYLLMHAHNPVDWYPWGAEAFEKARRENKPVFLSVGYSSCYWCHVMERETFSNEKVAEYLNKHFVCIKVDREERPDVDDIYMTSLIVYQQASGGRSGGGWPLSMFLTPDGDPIAGATYLPPEDTPDGRTGFLTAAGRVRELWENDKESLVGSAAIIAREVRRLSGPTVLAEPKELSRELLDAAVRDIESRYDPVCGGVDFNRRNPDGPRFPSVPRLLFLLSLYEETSDERLLKIVDHSLTAMALGGIRDHLGGGFHRYSTDRHWIVPHFEKMLYDQAGLLEAYAHAARLTKNPLYLQVIDELVGFVRREMTLPEGGFSSALDAETNAIEGEYYVWAEAQVQKVLGSEEALLFEKTYGFDQPQSFEHGRVLYLPVSIEKLAADTSEDPATLASRLAAARQRLLQARSERPRPLLDDKVLTEWNALMIQGLAVSGRLPGREDDLQLAVRAADFLLSQLKDETGHLLRSWRNSTPGQRAYLDDYACLVSALRALHESTAEDRWLTAAADLMTQQIDLFYDDAQSAFFFTARDHEKLFARTSSPYDSVSPSGNSLTIRNLLDLGQQQQNARFRELAEAALKRFSGTLDAAPAACSGLALALQDWLKLNGASKSAALRSWSGGSTLSDPDSAFSRHAASIRGTVTGTFTSAGVLDESPPTVAGKKDVVVDGEGAAVEQQTFRPVIPDPARHAAFRRSYQERPVKAKVYPYFDKLLRGGKCPVAIELTIAKDWHINANPSNPDFLIPTEVRITSAQKVKVTKIKYPAHELLSVEGQQEKSHVYGGTVIIYALLEIDAAEDADKAELEVEIKFQACNEKTCEPPDAIKLKGKLPLAGPDDEIKRINESRFPKDDLKTDDAADVQGGKSKEDPSKE